MCVVKFLYGFIFVLWTSSVAFCLETWTVTEHLSNGDYLLSRAVDLNKKVILFTVIAKTTGYVGFGLSPNGGMKGADMFIGGVNWDGSTYFSDYHVNLAEPIQDTKNDWLVSYIKDNGTHTEMEFSRVFDTCDEQDVPINEDTLSIIWSYGISDSIVYHGGNRGSLRVNLLDPPMPSTDVSRFQTWNITVQDTMSAADTSYMCSIHPAPEINGVHHIVGFDALLPNPEAVEHTHHFNFWKCTVPPGLEGSGGIPSTPSYFPSTPSLEFETIHIDINFYH